MAELTLRLVVDPSTGKKNVIISYSSDSDALPIEHEDAHRALVEKLIEGGAIKAAELGRIVVEREDESRPNEAPRATETETPASEPRKRDLNS
jgi:hypothetical protein